MKADLDATYSPVWLRAKVIAWRNKLALSNDLSKMSAYSEYAKRSEDMKDLLGSYQSVLEEYCPIAASANMRR